MKKFKSVKSQRESQLAKFRAAINRDSYPRLEMLMLVSFTGLAGFLASYGLLNLGLNTIWLRYLVSIGVAYVVFLALLGVWLAWKTTNLREAAAEVSNPLEGVDIISDIPFFLNSAKTGNSTVFQGNGGSFDGGGASGDYISDTSPNSENGEIIGEAFGAAAQAEEGAIPLIVIGALILGLFSIFIATFSIVSSAPILFSELLVDGMLSASLYKRLKGIDSHHWLESAIKRTFWPFFFATLTFVVVGWTMEYFVPNAHSLGEILSRL